MDENKNQDSQVGFPVIGLGASAGGLEALSAFFEAMPVNSGMAFIVVQHLAPNQESILHELLQRHTKIRVKLITNRLPIQPNYIYVLPAAYQLTLKKGLFRLTQMPPNNGWPDTINRFFKSLAAERGDQAAALILSGAGHDGTEGAAVIKTKGGTVIAQDLDSATQNSMPFNIIDAGLADAVLSPESMPAYLLNYFNIQLPEISKFETLTEHFSDEDLKLIVRYLRRHTIYDFSDYKPNTLRRQIARRMGSQQISSVRAYIELMRKQVGEANQLVEGLLIHVTSFFRDTTAFDSLKSNALLPLLKSLSIDDVFRVWVPGCASGEEAVSLAIVIYECLRELEMLEMEVRIFATDVSRDLIQRARTGLYPLGISEQFTGTRLKDHFIKMDDGYQVRVHISRMIVWAEHNLTAHPPFSNLYLISCRNVLIYFQPQLQERIRALFQFALQPGGILFLGLSESMPLVWDMFNVIDSKQKIYRRMAGSAHQWMHLDKPLFAKPVMHQEEHMSAPKNPQKNPNPNTDDQKLRIIREMLLSHYSSTCVIVDENYHIRYTYGDIDRYLRLVPGGEVQQSILSMAREGLDAEVTIALYEAFNTQETVIRNGVWLKSKNDEHLIKLIVKPINDSSISNHYKLLIFEPIDDSHIPIDTKSENSAGQETAIVDKLRDELQQAHRALQSATQALQAKSEELSTSMEEISSANEEIQTTNEELHTSKEELESMNEELNTLNTQLTNQNQELSNANNALFNFLQTTAIAVIFLDLKLTIREYTQAATKIFSIRKNDVRRPLAEIKSQLLYENLIADATTVLDTLNNIEKEVESALGNWYRVEIRPYRTINNIIDGLVLTFMDVTAQKQAQNEAEQRLQYKDEILDLFDHSLLELDGNLRVVAANGEFYQKFKAEKAETEGQLLYDLGNGQWDIPELRRLLQELIPRNTVIRDYHVRHTFPTIGTRVMHLSARKIQSLDRILLIITEAADTQADSGALSSLANPLSE